MEDTGIGWKKLEARMYVGMVLEDEFTEEEVEQYFRISI